ncbi:uncharacterized protein BKA55DRAFT_375944 [Fusarium redolens]|uniref:Secreted protein n=1 Tax=Fusarium redolens TaxID=48865 RepID=A0A9P9KEQ9_FUSRE|nr:uncharacterized protein BKA55DRAFT_375944 [Fusarium redolens]KAH7250229.1 hypothetical protein BKA55DRAFT_375944 [Fusarium redolens]
MPFFLLSSGVCFLLCDIELRMMISSNSSWPQSRCLHQNPPCLLLICLSALRTSQPRSHQKPTGRGPTIPGAHAGSTAGDVMDHRRKNECRQDASL